jgi:hypothetical protein
MAVRLIDLQLLHGIAGAREQFENLCAQLFRSEHPSATGVRVHRGDGGIDVYNGEFTGEEGIHVVQVKFFPNGIKESQQKEIRDSLTRCVTNTQFKTKQWTLYLPVDLSIEETRWFEKWSKEKETEYGIVIDWKGATYLEGLLYQSDNRGIKETFFKEEYLTQIREMHGMLRELLDDFRTRSEETLKSRLALVRDFRKKRLDKIRRGELLCEIEKGQELNISLHIIPLSTSEEETRLDLSPLALQQNARLLEPFRLYSGGYNYPTYSFDGLTSKLPDSYVHVFPNGSIEAVDTSILSASREYRRTAGEIYEMHLLRALTRFLEAQKLIGIEPPLLVTISFFGVKDYCIAFKSVETNWLFQPENYRIDRAELLLPETTIETFNSDLIEIMRPTFDVIAQSAHWPKSQVQDEQRRSWLTNT